MFPPWHTKQFVKKHALRKLELVMNHLDQKHIMNKYAVFKINKTLFSPSQGSTELDKVLQSCFFLFKQSKSITMTR